MLPNKPLNEYFNWYDCYHFKAQLLSIVQDPKNVDALVALAIFEINAGAIPSAMKMLEAAYTINSTHPVVLNQLANHFFFKKDYKTVHSLAAVAYHGTEVAEIKAESCYYLARNYHAQEEYEKAF